MVNKQVFFTRHGETQWNTVRRIQGHQDSPLTELGIEQAQWLREVIMTKGIEVIYSSPLGRAYETAKIIKGESPIELIICDELKEINMGSWEGKLISEVEIEDPIRNGHFWNEPHKYVADGGEDFIDLRKRNEHFVRHILQISPYNKILVVTHAIALKSMIAYARQVAIEDLWKGPHIQPTSLTETNYTDNGFEFVTMGDISHHQRQSTFNGWFNDK